MFVSHLSLAVIAVLCWCIGETTEFSVWDSTDQESDQTNQHQQPREQECETDRPEIRRTQNILKPLTVLIIKVNVISILRTPTHQNDHLQTSIFYILLDAAVCYTGDKYLMKNDTCTNCS